MIATLGTEFVHFYLLEQDGEVTLVDAGLRGYRDTLEPALAQMGRSISDVKAIVLTHADPDHIGLAGELQDAHGIPVYVHSADSERLRQGKNKKSEGSPLEALSMLRHGHSRRLVRHMISNGIAKPVKIAKVTAFNDGDVLAVPGQLTAIHTPGHTDGHCVLYSPTDHALFVGDALNNISLLTGEAGAMVPPNGANTSNAQARASLAKIETIDAETVYFGHGNPSTAGPKAIVAEARAND